MQTLILIPAYNEAHFLKELLPCLKRLPADILVVDDGSSDRTSQVAKDMNVHLLRNPVNCGKGAALKKGFRYALDKNYQQVVTVDADGQHLPVDVKSIMEHSLSSDADIIIGNRMWNLHNMPFLRKFTNIFMSKLISSYLGVKIPDTQCGLKLIRRRVLEKIRLQSRKFEIESEILIEAVKKGFRVESYCISTIYPWKRNSYIRPFRDTLRFFRYIFSCIWSKA